MTFAGISKARARLSELVQGLRVAASGAVVQRAAAKVQEQISSVTKAKLSKHVFTGNAQGTATVAAAGGLVQLTAPAYLHFHGWWPFRSGMPPFVVTRAAKIFEAELVAALGGLPSPLALADAAAEEVAEARRAKQAKREARRAEAHQKAIARDQARVERGRRRAEREGRAEARRGSRPE